jgi:ribonuclease P protein component
MLQKRFRLSSKSFQNIYKNGIKIRGKYGMLVYTSNNSGITPQFGFVISKKIGNAPKRHRMNRILRVLTHQAVEEFNMLDNGKYYQYIAFEFCNDSNILREEYFKQIEKSLKD